MLSIKVMLSVVMSEDLRTNAAEAGEFGRDWRVGDSGNADPGRPISRLVS